MSEPGPAAPGPTPGTPEAAAIASAVLAVPGIAALSAGPAGQYRSYLPDGSTVPGVRLDGDVLEVNVVTRYGPALPELGDRVRAALGAHLHGRTATVTIDDIVLPGEPDPVTGREPVEAAEPVRSAEPRR